MIVPSIEDACPKTPIESSACGTPVVCFDSTGLKDIVEHQKSGYRAECFSSNDLARGIVWILDAPDRYDQLCRRAREKVEQEFSLELQASRYLKLYSDIINHNKTSKP